MQLSLKIIVYEQIQSLMKFQRDVLTLCALSNIITLFPYHLLFVKNVLLETIIFFMFTTTNNLFEQTTEYRPLTAGVSQE